MAKAQNLHELINNSSSTRQYFLSLPVPIQMKLHEQNEWIHTAQELHKYTAYLEKAAVISNN